MDELSETEPMKQDFNFLDANYGGVRPLEIAVTLKDTNHTFWERDLLLEVEKVEDYMENVYGATVKTSLVKAIKVMNRSSHGGNVERYKIPKKKRDIKRMRRPLRMADKGNFYRLVVDSTERVMRINGAMPDWGSAVVMEKNEHFQKFLTEEINSELVDYQLTGTAHLFDKNISYLSTSMVKGLSLSVLIVALIMGLLYRSVTMVLISMVPNLLPLLFIGGLMGYLGLN